MSSGHGFGQNRPPCFAFWRVYQKCYAGADFNSDCKLQLDDFLECTTHDKEIARAQRIQKQYAANLRKEGKSAKEVRDMLHSGIAVSVGLIQNEQYESAAAN